MLNAAARTTTCTGCYDDATPRTMCRRRRPRTCPSFLRRTIGCKLWGVMSTLCRIHDEPTTLDECTFFPRTGRSTTRCTLLGGAVTSSVLLPFASSARTHEIVMYASDASDRERQGRQGETEKREARVMDTEREKELSGSDVKRAVHRLPHSREVHVLTHSHSAFASCVASVCLSPSFLNYVLRPYSRGRFGLASAHDQRQG